MTSKREPEPLPDASAAAPHQNRRLSTAPSTAARCGACSSSERPPVPSGRRRARRRSPAARARSPYTGHFLRRTLAGVESHNRRVTPAALARPEPPAPPRFVAAGRGRGLITLAVALVVAGRAAPRRSRARGRPTDGHPLREARERPAGGAGLRGVVSPHGGRDRAAGHGSVEDRGRAVQVHRVRPRPGARPRAGEAAAPRVPRPAGGEEASGFGSAAKAEAVNCGGP